MIRGVAFYPIRGLLYADHFLVTWEWRHYFWATLLAIIAVLSRVMSCPAGELLPVVTVGRAYEYGSLSQLQAISVI
jgi:hypothetical protein